jgi:Beta/Gamma crystallin
MKALTSLAVCLAVLGLSAGTSAASAETVTATKKSPAKKGLLILYNGQKFQGDFLEIKKLRTSMGEDMRVGSIAVFPGEAWEICEGARFKGACRVVTADEMNLGSQMVNSVRPAPATPTTPSK